MAAGFQSSLRKSQCNILMWILAVALVALSIYSYKMIQNYEKEIKRTEKLRERLRESLLLKTNYERRSQQCISRIQELEEMKKSAEESTKNQKLLNEECTRQTTTLKRQLKSQKSGSDDLLIKISNIIKMPAKNESELVRNVKDIYDIFLHTGLALSQLQNNTKLLTQKYRNVSVELKKCESSPLQRHYQPVKSLISPSSSAAKLHGKPTPTPLIKTESLLEILTLNSSSKLNTTIRTKPQIQTSRRPKVLHNSKKGAKGLGKLIKRPTHETTETLPSAYEGLDINPSIAIDIYPTASRQHELKATPKFEQVKTEEEDKIEPPTRISVIEDSESDAISI